MDQTKRTLRSIEEYHNLLSNPSERLDIKTNSPHKISLTLNRRDLPKFQLSTAVIKHYPNEESFESVEHFLRTFEKVIASSTSDIEKVWKKYLPLCLPSGDDHWIENTLLKCTSWAYAREAFSKHHGSTVATRRFVEQVFTMKMHSKESIVEYSKRFLQTMYSAGIPRDDPRVVDRFLASLIVPIQAIIRMAIVSTKRSTNDEEMQKWTVESLTELARDVLADDNSAYKYVMSLIPGSYNETIDSNHYKHNEAKYKKQMMKHKKQNKIQKPKLYYCKHHGQNHTHNTETCFFLTSKAKEFTSDKNEAKKFSKNVDNCFVCGEVYTPNHKCNRKESKPVLAASDPIKEDIAAMEKELNIVDTPLINNEDIIMEDNQYD